MALFIFVSKILNKSIELALKSIELPLVHTMEFLRGRLKFKTYQVENITVFTILIMVLIATRSELNIWKWVELLAVFFTFLHASIAQRLEERQRQRHLDHGEAEVDCYYKLPWYLVGKEILWLITFVYLGAWAALAGVMIFLAYYPWRSIWRKYHPVAKGNYEPTPHS
ncbi:MAG: hypothetical protein M3Q64_03575 [bacterium]|nr:hypothetical protein [bacterium]